MKDGYRTFPVIEGNATLHRLLAILIYCKVFQNQRKRDDRSVEVADLIGFKIGV